MSGRGIDDWCVACVAEALWDNDKQNLASHMREHWRSASANEQCRYRNMARAAIRAMSAVMLGEWKPEPKA